MCYIEYCYSNNLTEKKNVNSYCLIMGKSLQIQHYQKYYRYIYLTLIW